MRWLDLFCCAGGSAMGMIQAGHKVTGIDIEPQPEYPGEFIQKNVFDLDPIWIKENFEAIWASPICQRFTWGTRRDRDEKFENQIPATRELLKQTGLPYIIENVPAAPLRRDVFLCGEMFGLRVLRHRIFEMHEFKSKQPVHPKHKRKIDLIHSYYSQVAGHGGDSYSFKLSDWQKDMGITHITDVEHLVEAIPPAYSKYLTSNLFSGKLMTL